MYVRYPFLSFYLVCSIPHVYLYSCNLCLSKMICDIRVYPVSICMDACGYNMVVVHYLNRKYKTDWYIEGLFNWIIHSKRIWKLLLFMQYSHSLQLIINRLLIKFVILLDIDFVSYLHHSDCCSHVYCHIQDVSKVVHPGFIPEINVGISSLSPRWKLFHVWIAQFQLITLNYSILEILFPLMWPGIGYFWPSHFWH